MVLEGFDPKLAGALGGGRSLTAGKKRHLIYGWKMVRKKGIVVRGDW